MRCKVSDVVLAQVLLQRGVMWFSATRDHRHVSVGRPKEEAERPADPAEPRDPKRCAYHQLSHSLKMSLSNNVLILFVSSVTYWWIILLNVAF